MNGWRTMLGTDPRPAHSRRLAGLLSTLLVALSLTSAGSGTAATATTSQPGFVIFRHLPADSWSVRSLACDLTPSPGAQLRPARVTDAARGSGALVVTSGAGRIAGALRLGPGGLADVVTQTVRATGEVPTGLWRYESSGHVLTSDPVALDRDRWTTVNLAEATLHEGSWTGTLADFRDQFGRHAWAAGLLTGDCLGSPTTQVDTVLNGRRFADFEPPLWLDVDVSGSQARNATTYDVAYRTRATITARMIDVDPKGADVPQSGKRLELWRRPAGRSRWTRVLRGTTNQAGVVRARSRVTVVARYQWRRPGGELRSATVLVRPKVAITARIVGHGVSVEDGHWQVPTGRGTTVIGRIRPARSTTTVAAGRYLSERALPTDRRGRFRIVLPALRAGDFEVRIDSSARRAEDSELILSVVVTRRPGAGRR